MDKLFIFVALCLSLAQGQSTFNRDPSLALIKNDVQGTGAVAPAGVYGGNCIGEKCKAGDGFFKGGFAIGAFSQAGDGLENGQAGECRGKACKGGWSQTGQGGACWGESCRAGSGVARGGVCFGYNCKAGSSDRGLGGDCFGGNCVPGNGPAGPGTAYEGSFDCAAMRTNAWADTAYPSRLTGQQLVDIALQFCHGSYRRTEPQPEPRAFTPAKCNFLCQRFNDFSQSCRGPESDDTSVCFPARVETVPPAMMIPGVFGPDACDDENGNCPNCFGEYCIAGKSEKLGGGFCKGRGCIAGGSPNSMDKAGRARGRKSSGGANMRGTGGDCIGTGCKGGFGGLQGGNCLGRACVGGSSLNIGGDCFGLNCIPGAGALGRGRQYNVSLECPEAKRRGERNYFKDVAYLTDFNSNLEQHFLRARAKCQQPLQGDLEDASGSRVNIIRALMETGASPAPAAAVRVVPERLDKKARLLVDSFDSLPDLSVEVDKVGGLAKVDGVKIAFNTDGLVHGLRIKVLAPAADTYTINDFPIVNKLSPGMAGTIFAYRACVRRQQENRTVSTDLNVLKDHVLEAVQDELLSQIPKPVVFSPAELEATRIKTKPTPAALAASNAKLLREGKVLKPDLDVQLPKTKKKTAKKAMKKAMKGKKKGKKKKKKAKRGRVCRNKRGKRIRCPAKVCRDKWKRRIMCGYCRDTKTGRSYKCKKKKKNKWGFKKKKAKKGKKKKTKKGKKKKNGKKKNGKKKAKSAKKKAKSAKKKAPKKVCILVGTPPKKVCGFVAPDEKKKDAKKRIAAAAAKKTKKMI